MRLDKMNAVAVEAYNREIMDAMSNPQRLKATYGAQFILRAKREQLNTICSTAMQVLGSAGAAVNLDTADVHEEVGIAQEGTDQPFGDVRRGLCKYVVGSQMPFGVENALEHNLVCTHEVVTEHGLRSYLGVPLITKEALVVGALCVWDGKPREWTSTEVNLLISLAGVVMGLM